MFVFENEVLYSASFLSLAVSHIKTQPSQMASCSWPKFCQEQSKSSIQVKNKNSLNVTVGVLLFINESLV
jgi:hypothetical protein